MTSQGYAASKAEEARGLVDLYQQRMSAATTTEEHDEAMRLRDEAQHRVDINSGFADTLEHNQRELANSASRGNLDDLIELNTAATGGTPPTLDTLADIVNYTNDQMSTYGDLATDAQTAYLDAVSRQAAATDPEQRRMYAMEAEQHRTEFEEYSRLRDANLVAQLTAITNDSASTGDFENFARANLEIATPAALSDPTLVDIAVSDLESGGGAAEYGVLYFILEGLLGLAVSRIRVSMDPKKRKREKILKGVNVHD